MVMILSLMVTLGLTGCGPEADTTGRWEAARPAAPARPKPTPRPTRPRNDHHHDHVVTLTRGPAGSVRVTGSTRIALTFDDGPDPVNTPRMLDLLRQYHVKATFCVIGVKVRAHPELVRRIVAEGHTLCNHSYKHLLNLGEQRPTVIRADLKATLNAIHAAVPGVQVRYFRAPGGNFTPQMDAIAASMGMTVPLYWQVDPADWDAATFGHGTPMVTHIVGNVQYCTRRGSIILSHDIHPDTITAYRTLLPWLTRHFTISAQPR
jgi:peptidoglycan/xylan/chitin deacetylase (PgdA/CDA1 family)